MPEPVAIKKKVNLRTPDVMSAVQAQVESHYRSNVVERLKASGGALTVDGLTIKLAKQFGFCYGVERAIDLAYAARKVFTDQRLYILGEIIHNPEVNQQIADLGIKNLVGPSREPDLSFLTAEDVVSDALGSRFVVKDVLKQFAVAVEYSHELFGTGLKVGCVPLG